jgi:hypothetical protein
LVYLILFCAVWITVTTVGILQRRSKVLSIVAGYVAAIGVFVGARMLFEDDAHTTAIEQTTVAPVQTPKAKTAQQVPQPGPQKAYLSESALICRAADQVPKYLADLKNNRAPNKADCAFNPSKKRMRVDIVARQTIGQEVVVHWRKPSNGFEGWTLESYLVF